jgi:hypothetical protein
LASLVLRLSGFPAYPSESILVRAKALPVFRDPDCDAYQASG